NPNSVRCREPTDSVSSGEFASAARFLPRSCRNGKSFCARIAHGRAGPRGENRSVGISSEESFRCTIASCFRKRGKNNWLAAKENTNRSGIWNGRRGGKEWIRRDVRGNRGGSKFR